MTYEHCVRRYGCLTPLDLGPDVIRQARLQAEFYGRLIAIHRAYLAERDAVIAADPEIQGMDARIAQLEAERDELKTSRADRARLKEIGASLKVLYRGHKARRAEVREGGRQALAAINAQHNAAVTAARQQIAQEGLWWPNYNAVIARAATALEKVAAVHGAFRDRPWSEGDAWTGEGRFRERLTFTFQVQGSMSAEALFGSAMRQLGITSPAPDAFAPGLTEAERKRRQHCTLTLAVYPTEDGYRTLTVPVRIHQPIPDGMQIQQATLQRRRQGARWRWELILLLRREALETPGRTGEIAGMDVGWRKRPDGSIRIAAVHWGQAECEEIALPAAWLEALRRCREEHGDLAREGAALIADLAVRGIVMAGETLQEQLRSLRRHVDSLKTQPFGEALRDLLEWDADCRAAANWRARLLRWRLDLYRTEVKRIAERAAVIGLDDSRIDARVKALASLPARSNRVGAAISEFVGELKRAVKASGARIIAYESGTNLCHSCGRDPQPVDRSALIWQCHYCRAIYDQDHNSARLLRRRAMADSSGPEPLKTPAPLESSNSAVLPVKLSRSERLRAAKSARKKGPLENALIPSGASMG